MYIFMKSLGEAVKVDEFINYLKELDVKVSAVFTQFCETSTGVLHPVQFRTCT